MGVNVLDKIEEFYDNQEAQPEWAAALQAELKEIKLLLKNISNPRRDRRKNRDYYQFVNLFRKKMCCDVVNNKYPEVVYRGRKIGVDHKGYLYNKETSNTLPSKEAFELYEYFYKRREKIDQLIVK